MDKVMILQSREQEHGEKRHRLLYWYAIAPRVTDFLANEMTPQGRGDLPPDARQKIIARDRDVRPEASDWGEPDLAMLDAGDAGFEILERTQSAGETLAAFAARMLADHGLRQAYWIQRQRQQHAQAGMSTS